MEYPDWEDNGKAVVVELQDGLKVRGKLDLHDFFFDGENEIPLFNVIGTNGELYKVWVHFDDWDMVEVIYD